MPNPHPAALPVDELLKHCDIEKTRRGGPGGQHRNKVETAIVIRHRPTSVSGQAGERRSQHANRQEATFRLRLNLAVGIRTPIETGQVPSKLWQSRCQQGKIRVNSEHEDFPGLLAEALDWLARFEFETGAAAEVLQVSGSQLVKFLKKHPPALVWVNQQREILGKSRLR